MSNAENIKNKIRSNMQKAVIGTALFASMNANAQQLSTQAENNKLKRNKIETFKATKLQEFQNTYITTLCSKGFYEEAYRLQTEANPDKYGHIKNVDYENEIQNIKAEIVSDYQIAEGIVDNDMTMRDVPVEFMSKFLDENPDKKNFLEKLNKEKHYLNLKDKTGKLESIFETADNTFREVDEVTYSSYQLNPLAYYNWDKNQIALSKIITPKNMKLDEETNKAILKQNNLIDSARYEKNRGAINRILIHELEHQSQQEKGVDYAYYTTNKAKNEINFDLSVEDADRREQIKETMAEVNVMLAMSEAYVKGDSIPEDMQKAFPEYMQAINEGKINPKDFSKDSKDKEFSLIMNLATNNWNETRKKSYHNQIEYQVRNYAQIIQDTQDYVDEENFTISTFNKKSTPLVWGMIKEKLTTFKYMGEKINLSKHLEEEKFTPNRTTTMTSMFLDKHLSEINNIIREKEPAQQNNVQPPQRQGR